MTLPVTFFISNGTRRCSNALRVVFAAIVVVIVLTSAGTGVTGAARCLSGLLTHAGDITAGNEVVFFVLLVFAGAIYAAVLSVPFVPAWEIGILLMLLCGDNGVVAVYLFTLAGLALSFGCGRRLRNRRTASALVKICRSAPAGIIVERMSRLESCGKIGPYLLTGVLLNFPFNSLVGGGGGIALLSGYSRSTSWHGFLITVAIATAPVPLAILAGLSLRSGE